METQTTITIGAGAGFIWLLGIYIVGFLITKSFVRGLIAPIGAEASLLAHEYAHAIAAKMMGVAAPVIDVTDFSGLTHMSGGFNPDSPEGFLILGAGPVCNIIISWLAWKYLKNRREVMWMVIGVNLLLIWLSYNEPNGDIRRMLGN